jgi:hypothetical protein
MSAEEVPLSIAARRVGGVIGARGGIAGNKGNRKAKPTAENFGNTAPKYKKGFMGLQKSDLPEDRHEEYEAAPWMYQNLSPEKASVLMGEHHAEATYLSHNEGMEHLKAMQHHTDSLSKETQHPEAQSALYHIEQAGTAHGSYDYPLAKEHLDRAKDALSRVSNGGELADRATASANQYMRTMYPAEIKPYKEHGQDLGTQTVEVTRAHRKRADEPFIKSFGRNNTMTFTEVSRARAASGLNPTQFREATAKSDAESAGPALEQARQQFPQNF